jgi:hypothetical protein
VRVALFFAALSLLAAPRRPAIPAISVCRALDDRLRLNGKIVSIRGYEESTDEGSWLKSDCDAHVTTGGHVWPDLIWLSTSHQHAAREIAFQTDMDALQRFGDATAKAARSGRKYRAWVTYEGLFETEGGVEAGDDKVGPDQGVGFGHLNGAPAQLVIKTVRDIKIEYLGSGPAKPAKP